MFVWNPSIYSIVHSPIYIVVMPKLAGHGTGKLMLWQRCTQLQMVYSLQKLVKS